jgi:fimbrial isopeptide formation D2 family protein/uncharacterized repeat protein (TIGR01451 family)
MVVALFSVMAAFLPSWADPAIAAGSPDIALTKSMPAETLYGAATGVTLTASNGTGTDGFNLSFNDVIPADVTIQNPDPAPTQNFLDGSGNRVLIWENVADLQAGTTVSVAYEFVAANPNYVVGDSVANSAGAYVSTNPRVVPDFDPTTGAATGDFTGSATSSATTTLIPYTLAKAEPSTESELLRGVHDQVARFALTVTNNQINATSDFQIEDFLPAGLEFLGCGGVDNTTGGALEYPGAAPLGAPPAPALTNCVPPSVVETVQNPAGLPPGIYTHMVWTAADLNAATAGQDDLAAGGTLTIDYQAAIPLRSNVLFPGGTATNGIQTANLDNNTGPLTTDEQGLTNHATTFGTYSGPIAAGAPDPFIARASEGVTAEDVSIHKSVDVSTIEQTDVSTWTLLVETSEYATSTTSIVVTDTVPDGLCPVAAGTPCSGTAGTSPPSPLPASVTEDPSTGIWTLVWNLANLPAPNSTSTVTFQTVAETTYTTGSTPVSARDSWTNTVALTSSSAVITANNGSTTSLTIDDTSSAGQSAGGISIKKEVSAPVAGTLTCGNGSTITWDPASGGPYRPGDRVCWRLTVDFPALLDTRQVVVSDFLPPGFAFESSQDGANHTAGLAYSFDPAALTWSDLAAGGVPGYIDVGSLKFEVVVSSYIGTDPAAAADADILANLMKVTYRNTAGSVFQLRDQANVVWGEPELSLNKGVIDVDDVAVPGAPADGVEVQAGDVVTYQVAVTNGGSIGAEATSIRDVLPTGITCSDVSAVSAPGACSAADGWIQWNGLTIGAAGAVNLTYDVTIPNGVAAGAGFDNTAGVRRYQTPTNRAPPDDVVEYRPNNNIDPNLTGNTGPVGDTSSVVIRQATIDKAHTSSVDEPGNDTAQGTIGETINYTITVVIPEGSTLYGPATVTDTISDRLTHVAGTASATLDTGAGPVALPAGWTLADTGTAVTVTFPTPYVNLPGTGDDELIVAFSAVVDDEAANARPGSIPNSANLRWEDAAGIADVRSDSDPTPVVEPNLSISKSDNDGDGAIVPGQIVTFTVTPTNTSGTQVSTAYEVRVVDTVPAQFTPQAPYGGGTWNATARTITWDIASLAPGASSPLTYLAQAADPLLGSSSIVNSVRSTATSMQNSVAGERTSYEATADNTLLAPTLGIAKSADPTLATVGEKVEYTLDVTIPTDVILFDVTVVDDLPDGVIYDATTSATCDQGGVACSPAIVVSAIGSDGDAVAWHLGDLDSAAPADRVVTIVYEVHLDDAPAVTNGATLSNSAVVVGNQTNLLGVPSAPPNPASYDLTSTPATSDVDVVEPAVTIDKDVNGQAGDSDARRAVPGETLTYTLAVTNTGTRAAWDIDVTDTPDPDLALVDVPAGAGYTVVDGDPTNGSLAWTITGPLAPSATFTLTYQLQVPPGFDEANEIPGGPEFVNTADVPHFFGVDPTSHLVGRDYRDYDTVAPDVVSIEADLASIGDRVWLDVDDDGVQDPGEPGLANVDVTVTYLGPDANFGTGDDESVTVTTNSSGVYLVEDLPGGDYRIVVDATDLPTGLSPSFDLDGTTTSPDGSWSDVLPEDAAKRDVDFGYTGSGTIGDTIWFDRNGNGTVDAEEPGLAGIDVVVTWLGPDNAPAGGDDVIYTATTAADGTYLVRDLPAGEFTVAVDVADLPPGFSQISDPDATVDNATTITLGAGASEVDADFGYRGAGSIGDFVWLDLNGDGVQDGGEPGTAAVFVELTWYGPDNSSGGGDDALFTTTTGAAGDYLFDFLPPGGYVVEVTGGLPAFVVNSFDEDGGADSSAEVTLANGENHLTTDFGYFGTTSIGDRVWWDFNSDGIQQTGEPGLGGVEVTVTYAGADTIFGNVDDQVFTTLTNQNGDYLVSGLPGGSFRIEVTDGLGTGFAITYDENDGTTGPDGVTTAAVPGDTVHLTADFGYVGSGSLGDTVWLDTNGDGIVDPGEDGITAVTVDLLWLGPDGVPGGGNDVSLQTTTDANGNYSFGALPAGSFTITVDATSLPPSLAPSYDLDSTRDGSTEVVLAGGDNRTDVDFGYRNVPPPAGGAISGVVWNDQDRDGVRDPDEAGIGGVTVTVSRDTPSGPAIIEVVTNPDGSWSLVNISPADYTVEIDLDTIPTGLTPTTPSAVSLTLSSASSALVEHGVGPVAEGGSLSSIGSTVWVDADRNGVVDPDEEGLSGVRVQLVDASGAVVAQLITDADGGYLFDNVASGTYTVRLDATTIPARLEAVSDRDGEPDLTTVVSVSGGSAIVDANFGFAERAVLPFTGLMLATGALAAVLLILSGSGLIGAGRRRRSDRSDQN